MKKFAILLAILFCIATASALAEYGAIIREDATAYTESDLSGTEIALPRFTAVVVKSEESGRAEILFGGDTLYIDSGSLSQPWVDFQEKRSKQGIEHTEDCIRYVKETCTVYDYPSAEAHSLKQVKEGTVLTGFMEQGGWSIVMDESETYYGYIETSCLEGISGGDGSHYELE